MPFFEYRCDECKKKFEIFTLSISKKPDNKCVLCGSNRTHKIMSLPGIIFKGSGFYVTDSKKSSPDNSENINSDNKRKKEAAKIEK